MIIGGGAGCGRNPFGLGGSPCGSSVNNGYGGSTGGFGGGNSIHAIAI